MDPSKLALLAEEFKKHADTPLSEPRGKIPQGHYTVVVEKCYWDQAGTGTDFLCWELVIADGEHAGRRLYHKNYLKLNEPIGLKKLMQDLKLVLGRSNMEDFNLADPAFRKECTEKMLYIKKRDKGDFYEIYINGVDRRVEPTEEDSISDEDIPF